MPNILPNTGVEVWNDTTDADNNFQLWYNKISGMLDSNMIKLDNSVGDIFEPKIVSGHVNDLIHSGIYYGSLTGAPIEGVCFYGVISRKAEPTFVTQFCYSWLANDRKYSRTLVAGTWGAWGLELSRDVNGKTNAALGYVDARNVEPSLLNPLYYSETIHNRNGLLVELQEGDNVGLPSGLYAISTINPWHDHTAGTKQIAHNLKSFDSYIRYATSSTIWGGWASQATNTKQVFQLTPVSGWEKTPNDVCRVTRLGSGMSKLELELKATTDIGGGLACVVLPQECWSSQGYEPIAYALDNGTTAVGYIYGAYEGGAVKMNNSVTVGTILRVNVMILNI